MIILANSFHVGDSYRMYYIKGYQKMCYHLYLKSDSRPLTNKKGKNKRDRTFILVDKITIFRLKYSEIKITRQPDDFKLYKQLFASQRLKGCE